MIDVAAGPGTVSLLAARNVARVVAVDFASEMVDHLEGRAADAGLTNIEAHVADGQSLPFEDGLFDAGFSMFGLMFFPDRAVGFRELRRVLKPGGRAVVSSWVAAERVQARSSAPVALLRERLDSTEWEELGESVVAQLEGRFGTGPLNASFPAHLGTGLR